MISSEKECILLWGIELKDLGGGGGATGKVLDEHAKVERDEFSTGRNLQIPN